MCHLMSLINSEVKRSYSTLNISFFVLKFFFEGKKSSVNMAMNSHSIFRLAENGVKINSLICGNTLSYEMSFNDFRFQLNEELSLLFDHGNRTWRKKTRGKRGKIMPKVFIMTTSRAIYTIITIWCIITLFSFSILWSEKYI